MAEIRPRMKWQAKLVIFALVAVFAFYFASKYIDSQPVAENKASVAPKADLPQVKDAPSNIAVAEATGKPMAIDLSSVTAAPAQIAGPEIRFEVWAWNSQFGLMLANGGPKTTEGSLMAKRGVKLALTRQDDTKQNMASLLAFASALKKGEEHPKDGKHFIAIMGDGGGQFMAALQPELAKLGPEYMAEFVGSCGYSRGEDKFMAPPDCKADPQNCRGLLVAGVLKDGDWNIAVKYAADNDIPVNPDDKTYDPLAINWVNVDTYIDAAQKYVAGYCEPRKVVSKGRLTGEEKKVCINGVVTWTPGDVMVAHNKGGLVSVVSTKEYRAQMPNGIIGIKKWNAANAPLVANMLAAIFDGGDLVKASPLARRKAAEISAVVYNGDGEEKDPAYWEKYYVGTVEKDKRGLSVELGGSYANNLADNFQLFGLAPGSSNLFEATYTIFGKYVVHYYPKDVPSFPPAKDVINTTYLVMASKLYKEPEKQKAAVSAAAADLPVFAPAPTPVKEVVSKRAWTINFETGKATFTKDAKAVLEELAKQLEIAGGLAVEIHGHTDNVGSARRNMSLSEERAFAVKNWLENKSPTNFPPGRIRAAGHGQDMPLAPNSTAAGRAKNRRVDIVLGKQ